MAHDDPYNRPVWDPDNLPSEIHLTVQRDDQTADITVATNVQASAIKAAADAAGIDVTGVTSYEAVGTPQGGSSSFTDQYNIAELLEEDAITPGAVVKLRPYQHVDPNEGLG